MPNDLLLDSLEWEVLRLSGSGSQSRVEKCLLAVEDILTLEIRDVGSYTLMCSPNEPVALAVGFAFSENIIETVDDIGMLSRCPDDPMTIRMQLVSAGNPSQGSRNLIVSTACGMCGGRKAVEEILSGMTKVSRDFAVRPSRFPEIMERMREQQSLYIGTGGAHAAAVFDQNGNILSMSEDVGRHNALDKSIGKCLLARKTTRGYGVALSGRVSLEMVSKAARAGLELIAAVSAPSSLGVECAERCGITLCALVRGDKATVYTHPERLAGRNSV